MDLHANAKLGQDGRREVVLAIEAGLSLRAAPAALNVSPATLHCSWHRWLEGGRTGSALVDRSSRPRPQPRSLRPVRCGSLTLGRDRLRRPPRASSTRRLLQQAA